MLVEACDSYSFAGDGGAPTKGWRVATSAIELGKQVDAEIVVNPCAEILDRMFA